MPSEPLEVYLTKHSTKRFCQRQEGWNPLPEDYENFSCRGNYSNLKFIGKEEIEILKEELNRKFPSVDFYENRDPQDFGILKDEEFDKSFILERRGGRTKAVTYKCKEGSFLDTIEVNWA